MICILSSLLTFSPLKVRSCVVKCTSTLEIGATLVFEGGGGNTKPPAHSSLSHRSVACHYVITHAHAPPRELLDGGAPLGSNSPPLTRGRHPTLPLVLVTSECELVHASSVWHNGGIGLKMSCVPVETDIKTRRDLVFDGSMVK